MEIRGDSPDMELSGRRFPIGAELDKRGAHFRVWAPRASGVEVVVRDESKITNSGKYALAREGDGYFSGYFEGVHAGDDYMFRLDEGSFPDPVSRFQPEGPHGPSQLVDPSGFQWSDTDWKGLARHGQVIYEMHIGTFTPEGDWKSAAQRLPTLRDLGVTALEVMPVADFSGRFGWGYDGVDFFAPTRLYGTPDEFRGFVDEAHRHGMGVILDVVYNHAGPDGNFLKEFSPDYFTDRYDNEWGEAINFDGPESPAVREFFVTNAIYWIDEFHLDGLRLDATQQIFDSSERHILAEMAEAVRSAAGDRSVLLIAENESQDPQLVRSEERGGCGLDMLWNDDFHHTVRVALTGRSEAYYTDYKGTAQELVSAAKWGYLFQGQRYVWQGKRRGSPALDIEPNRFVNFIQNHDQIANSLRGQRIHDLGAMDGVRALTAFLLLSPGTPMLFQGQEFAASSPFLFFSDVAAELSDAVRQGRAAFLGQFTSIAQPAVREMLTDPVIEETFLASKLDFKDLDTRRNVFDFHRDLIAIRRSDPVIGRAERGTIDGAVIGPDSLLLRYFSAEHGDRLILFNVGRQLLLDQAPEPLLAPPEGRMWRQTWCSEDVKYGGQGMPPLQPDESWQILGRAAVLLSAEPEDIK
jgi:maltooligosyltrehalose trehalohydrolase